MVTQPTFNLTRLPAVPSPSLRVPQRHENPEKEPETPLNRLLPADFDAPEDPPPLSRQQRQHLAEVVFRQAFEEPRLTLADTETDRIQVAYRLVREMARHRGLLEWHQTLHTGLAATYIPPEDIIKAADDSTFADPDSWDPATGLLHDPWTTPRLLPRPVDYRKYQKADNGGRFSMLVIEEMIRAEVPAYVPTHLSQYQMVLKDNQWSVHHTPGLALMPPTVPHPSANDPDYDPNDTKTDPLLHRYIATLTATAAHLRMFDDERTRLGLSPLLDPTLCRPAFPSRTMLVTWETLLIQETLDYLVKNGQPITKDMLARKYGFQHHEITQLMRMARDQAQRDAQSDIEQDRAVMILRLEDVARRTRESLDMRAEIAALKALAIVQGLQRVEPENAMRQFIDVVNSYNDKAITAKSPEKGIALLPEAR